MKALIILFTGAVVATSDCSRKNNAPGTAVKNIEEIMTGCSWQVDELIRNIHCENSHYLKGHKNTTNVYYDNMRFSFRKNGKGTHTDQFGKMHQTSWQFDKSAKNTIHLTVHLSQDIFFTWRMV